MKRIIIFWILLFVSNLSYAHNDCSGGTSCVPFSVSLTFNGVYSAGHTLSEFDVFVENLDNGESYDENAPCIKALPETDFFDDWGGSGGYGLIFFLDAQYLKTEPQMTHYIKVTVTHVSTGVTGSMIYLYKDLNDNQGSLFGVDVGQGVDLVGPSTPDISISLSPTVLAYCEGATGGNVTAMIANSSDYSLTWKEGATDLSGNGLTLSGTNNTVATVDVSKFTVGAHTITVTATDNTTSKTATADFTLTINPKPTVSLTIDQTAVCEKTSVNLSAMASIVGGTVTSYTWADKTGFEPLTGSSSISAIPRIANTDYTYEVTVTSDKNCTATASNKLAVNAAPNVPALSAIPVVCEGNTVDLTACLPSTSSGIDHYEYYKGTFPSGIPVADATQIAVGGDYYIIGVGTTPTNCRSAAKPARIQINPLPDVKLVAQNNDTIICAEESVILMASGATRYDWGAPLSGTGSSKTVTPASTTTYTVTGTTGTCSKTVSREIKVNPLPTIAMTAQVGVVDVTDVCPGTTVILTADGKENGLPITTATQYVWTGGVSGNGLTKTVIPTGPMTTYNVEVETAAGCKASVSKSINVYTPEPIRLTPSMRVCVTEATTTGVTLIASGLTIPGSSYSWTDGGSFTASGTTQTVKPSVTTEYTVSGIDVHGCAATAVKTTVTVDPMPVLALAKTDLQSCSNVNLYSAIDATVAIPGTTYEYATDMAFTAPISLNVSTRVGAGTYFIRAKNGTCVTDVTNAHQVTVTILSSPTLDVNPSLAACDPDKVDLTSAVMNTNCSITYWKSDKTTEIILADAENISTTGVYYIKGTLGDCPALWELVQVRINPTPDVIVHDFAYCASTKGNLTATEVTAGSTDGLAYTYWVPGGRTPVATPTAVSAGNYKIVGTTAAGCADSAEVVVTENPLPVIATITPDQDACANTEITVSATATGTATLTYAWSATGGGSITSDPNQSSVTAKTATTGALNQFVVTVTDGNSCSASGTVKVTGHKVTPGTIAALPGSVIPCGSAVNLTVNGASCSESGCTSGLVYSWRPSAQIASSSTVNATSKDINNDTRFSVKVEDAHGCFDTAFIDITVKGCDFKFDPTVAMVDSICSGLTKNLTAKITGAEGIPNFVWSAIAPATGLGTPVNTSTTTTVELNTAGLTAGQVYEYEITATCLVAGQNVIRKDTVEVYIRPLPSFNRTSNGLACAKAEVPLSVTNVTGGTLKPGNSYAYAWSIAGQGSYTGAVNAANATGVMANAGGLNGFAVKVSDSYQCASYDTVKMTGHKINKGTIIPSIGTLVTKGTEQNLVLGGESCSEGDTPLTYTWGPTAALVTPATGNTVTTIGLQSTTNFYVEIKDVNNCFDTAKVSIAVGTLAIDVKADSVCSYLAGDTDMRSFEVTQPTGAGYRYDWRPIVGMSQSAFTLTDQTTSNAKVDIKSLVAGVYVAEVQVTQTSTSLVFMDTAYLLIRPLPTFDRTLDGLACAKAEVPLSVTNVTGGTLRPGDSYTYAWSIAGQGSYTGAVNAANATGVMANAGGLNGFAVKVSDSYQCASYDTVKMIGHKVNPGTIAGKTPVAAGTAQTLTVGGAACSGGDIPLTYTWGPVDSLVAPSTGADLKSVTTIAITGNTEFFVEVRDANNCFDTAKYQVNVGNLKLLATADTLCATGATTTAEFKVINPASGDKLIYAWRAIPGLSTAAFTITSANQPTTTASVTGAGVCAAEVKLTDSESGLELLDTAYIRVYPAPALAIAGTGGGCVGTTVNDVTATVTGGTAPIDYAWSGGLSGASPVVPVAVPGDNVYALTITDANRCQATASHTIVGHQVLVSGMANPGIILVSGVSDLTAVATATPAALAGTLRYEWSPATGLNTTTGSQVKATLSASQNYTVTVTDANNCSAVASVRVNVLNEVLAVTADNVSGCADEVLKLNARATGGTGSYRYTWSFTDPNLKLDDINSPTPVVLASTPAGEYTLTVMVNDGKSVKPSGTITVTKKALPTLAVTQTPVSGGVYDLTATVNPLTASCTWSPAGMLNGANTGATVRTVDLTVSQAYTVEAILDGCSASLPVLVNVTGSPMSVLASAEPGCENEDIYLNASAAGGDGDAANYRYIWSPGTGLTLSQTNVAAPKVVNTVPGTYSATVTVSDKGGKSATSNIVTVIVYPKPEVTVNTNAFACQDSEITLTAGGADTYIWLQGVNGTGAVKTATLTVTTLYQVAGASANGCRDTADYTVTMRNLPAVDVSVASDVCAGAEVTLTATPDIAANTYTWTGGMTGSVVKTTVATPGAVNFTVTVRDADGCINSATKSVTAHAVKVTAGATLNSDKSASLTATPKFFPEGLGGTPQYIWKDAAKLIAANVQNPTTVVLTQAETFMVKLTDGHGCADSSEVVVNVTGDGTILAATPGNVAGCTYDTLVLNANATGGDGNYEYTWLRGPGLTLSDSTLAMPEVWTSAPGTYVATVKVKSGGKEVTSAAVSITIYPKPTVTVPMPAAICSGTDITMTASGALQYNWLSGFAGVQTGASQTVTLAAGTTSYEVEGIDANQCRDTFEYDITPAAVPLIFAGADRSDVCAGDNVNLWATADGGQTPYRYDWGGVPATVVVAPGVNTYTVTVTDANECTATTTTGDIVGHQVMLTASAVLPILPIGGGVSNLTAVATAIPADGAELTYAWTPGDKLGGAADLASLPTVHLTNQQTYTVTVTDGYNCKATTDVTVNVQSETLSAFARGSLVCINTPATLTAMGLGGSGSYTYNWTGIPAGCTLDNATIANPTVLAGAPVGNHTFTVEVKDSENRTATATATVTVKALPQVRINGQQKQVADVCEGQTLTLTASNLTAGETTYFKWVKGFSGNGDTRSEIPTADKTYKVIGNTADGCADSATYDIKMQTNPSVIVTSPIADLCKGGDVMLTATANGGSGDYTDYSWADGQTGDQPTVTASAAGDNIYTVTVTDSKGCKATASTTVVGHEVTVAASALKNPVAYDSPATLLAAPTFNPSGKEGRVSYSWTDGGGTGISTSQIATTANLVADETFSVVVTDQYGCTATNSVTIKVQTPEGTPLDVNANMKTGTVCIGGSILLSAQAVGGNIGAIVPKYTYQWFVKGTTTILANTAAYMPAPTAPVTEYVVQVTDASLPTTKTAYDTVTLTMGTNRAPVANAGPDQTVKEGTATILGLASATATQGTKAYTYVWSPAGMLESGQANKETPLTVGLNSDTAYVVYIKDANNCISLPDEVKVKVADDMFTIAAKAAPASICQDNTSQLGVRKVGGTFVAGATFSWSPATNLSNAAIANPVFTAPTTAGTYPFTVTVTEGGRNLTTLVSVTVTSGKAPKLQFAGDPHCVGDSVKVTSSTIPTDPIMWYISDGTTNSTKAGKFYEFKASADYDIKVVTKSGSCTSDTLRGAFKIGSKPLVEIQAPRYLVGPKDTVFTFTANVTPGDTYGYTWTGTLFNPTGSETGEGGVGAASGSNMTATKLTSDVQYVVRAKGITANSCPAYDTVKVFVLPESPTIDIDTAADRYHSRIKLAGSDAWATGNTIWSRKWDPYCLTAEDGGKYMKEADLATSSSTWDEPAMDSLEFYYATSYREIAELDGARYEARKASADTVGYFLYPLTDANPSGASNNVWYPYYFDMTTKGVTTSADLLKRGDGNIATLWPWDFVNQSYGDPTMDLGIIIGSFNLNVGQVIGLQMMGNGAIMQYGKLPKPIEFNILGGNTGSNNNWAVLQPYRLDLKTSEDILLSSTFTAVSPWIYIDQIEGSPTMDLGIIIGSFDVLRPLFIPIQLENSSGANFLWK